MGEAHWIPSACITSRACEFSATPSSDRAEHFVKNFDHYLMVLIALPAAPITQLILRTEDSTAVTPTSEVR